jgi:hypothetical protein
LSPAIARAAQRPSHKILSRRDADVQAFARPGPRHAARALSRRRDHFLAWERTKQRLMVVKNPAVHSVQSTASKAVGEEGSMMSPQRPRGPAGADKSQQTKEQTTQHTAGSQSGPDYSVPPYGPGPGWPPYGMPYGPPPYGMPYGQQPYGMPYGQQPPGAPYGQQQPGAPFGPPPSGMPFGMCQPPFGPLPPFGPWQWFWSWLMPWWWSWLMSWWVFPGGAGGWQLPPFPNPAQYDMTMQFAATRAEFWRNSFEAASRVAQQAANASRFPVTPWPWPMPMPPAGPGYQPMPPDGKDRTATPEVNMAELSECLKSMSDPRQAEMVRWAVIGMQRGAQAYRRGRPQQSAGEDWR